MNGGVITQWLILLLDESLRVVLTARTIDDGFSVDGIAYDPVDAEQFPAVYDRLEDSDRRLVGIHVLGGEVLNAMFRQLSARCYVRFSKTDGSYDILFTPEATDFTPSWEQAFGGHLFRSTMGAVAMSVDIGYLAQSGRDFIDLKNAGLNWRELD